MTESSLASVWLDIPRECRIRAEFTGGRDIQFTIGEWCDGHTMVFERPALEEFVELAGQVLALSLPADRKAELPVLMSPAR